MGSWRMSMPVSILKNKDMSPREMLFLGVIESLTNQSGACTAKNDYFANLFNVDNRTISKWLRNLVFGGYIDITYKHTKNSRNGIKRVIHLHLDALVASQQNTYAPEYDIHGVVCKSMYEVHNRLATRLPMHIQNPNTVALAYNVINILSNLVFDPKYSCFMLSGIEVSQITYEYILNAFDDVLFGKILAKLKKYAFNESVNQINLYVLTVILEQLSGEVSVYITKKKAIIAKKLEEEERLFEEACKGVDDSPDG